MEASKIRPGTAFVGEHPDADDFLMWSGTFHVHWESPDGKSFRQGPEHVSLQDALEWARGHADEVYVRPGDSHVYYSAGVRHPEPVENEDETPIWPEGAVVSRRRQPGREYLDRTPDDPLIEWQIQLSYDLPAGDVPSFAEQFRAALEADPSVSQVTSSVRPGQVGQCAEFEFVVQARTQAEAHKLAEAVHDRAHQTAWPVLGKMPDGFVWSTMEDVRPVDSDPLV